METSLLVLRNYDVFMIKGEFEPVCDIKALSIDRFRDLIFELMVQLCVRNTARISTLLSLTSYLETPHDRFDASTAVVV